MSGNRQHPVRRHLVESPAGYIHVRTTGAPHQSQPELLFLHQIPASSRIWLPVMRELHPLPSIAPDMLNLGESDATDRPLTLVEQADLLWTASQAIWPGPKIVIGHHTGAAVAALMAARQRDNVVGLGLVGYPIYRTWQEKFAKFERLNPVVCDSEGEGVAAAWRFIRRAFAEDSNPELVFDAFADRIRAGRVWYEGYVALFTTDLDEVARQARSGERPTLLMAPERDVLSANADLAGELLNVAPVRTGGGAFVLTEDPTLVADQIRALHQQVVGQ